MKINQSINHAVYRSTATVVQYSIVHVIMSFLPRGTVLIHVHAQSTLLPHGVLSFYIEHTECDHVSLVLFQILRLPAIPASAHPRL